MSEENKVGEGAVEARGIPGILGNPEGFARGLCADSSVGARAALLVLVALGGAALFGFGVGSFVDWSVAFLDGLKSSGIVLFSYLLCLPSLYVFASLSGSRVGFVRLALIGFLALAAVGCVLAALAPILWLFAVSTRSAALFTLLAFGMVVVGVLCGFRTLFGIVRAAAVSRVEGLIAWLVILTLVALQMVTLMRPMLSPIGTARRPEGKCFFLEHFADCVWQEVR